MEWLNIKQWQAKRNSENLHSFKVNIPITVHGHTKHSKKMNNKTIARVILHKIGK